MSQNMQIQNSLKYATNASTKAMDHVHEWQSSVLGHFKIFWKQTFNSTVLH